ncbi:B3 domain-containing protein REM5 [Linum grandiflorum]
MAREGSGTELFVATCTPHFFQPLLPGFHLRLSIPIAFSKHLPADDEETVLLRSPAGKMYSVNITGQKFRGGGWKQFVSDHGLHVGDFLVFRQDASKVLDVMLFDPTSCESESPSDHHVPDVKKDQEHDSIPVDEQTETGLPSGTKQTSNHASLKQKGVWFHPKIPSVVVTIGRDNLKRSRMFIPKDLVRKIDLLTTTPCRAAVLLNGEGKSWAVNLHCYQQFTKNKLNCQVIIGRGFGKFLRQNKLKMGDTCSLEVVESGHSLVLRMSGLLKTKSCG